MVRDYHILKVRFCDLPMQKRPGIFPFF